MCRIEGTNYSTQFITTKLYQLKKFVYPVILDTQHLDAKIGILWKITYLSIGLDLSVLEVATHSMCQTLGADGTGCVCIGTYLITLILTYCWCLWKDWVLGCATAWLHQSWLKVDACDRTRGGVRDVPPWLHQSWLSAYACDRTGAGVRWCAHH